MLFERVLPFFLLIAAGALAARLKAFDAPTVYGLQRYTWWIGLPTLLLSTLIGADAPDAAGLRGLLAYAAGVVAPLGLALLIGRALGWGREDRAGAAMAAASSNTAFLGLPLALAVLGPEAGRIGGGLLAIDFSLIGPVALVCLHRAAGGGWREALRKTLLNPVVLAAALGALMMVLRLEPIAPLGQALSALAATGSPIGLIALGAVLALEPGRPGRGETAPVAVAALLKLIAAPACVWAAMRLAGASPAFTQAGVLLAASPTAVNVFIQTRAYGVFARGGARTVLATTVLSLATLSLLASAL